MTKYPGLHGIGEEASVQVTFKEGKGRREICTVTQGVTTPPPPPRQSDGKVIEELRESIQR